MPLHFRAAPCLQEISYWCLFLSNASLEYGSSWDIIFSTYQQLWCSRHVVCWGDNERSIFWSPKQGFGKIAMSYLQYNCPKTIMCLCCHHDGSADITTVRILIPDQCISLQGYKIFKSLLEEALTMRFKQCQQVLVSPAGGNEMTEANKFQIAILAWRFLYDLFYKHCQDSHPLSKPTTRPVAR